MKKKFTLYAVIARRAFVEHDEKNSQIFKFSNSQILES